MFGTKWPSITSRWKASAPPTSAARIAPARSAKSALRSEGASRRGTVRGPVGPRGVDTGSPGRTPALEVRPGPARPDRRGRRRVAGATKRPGGSGVRRLNGARRPRPGFAVRVPTVWGYIYNFGGGPERPTVVGVWSKGMGAEIESPRVQ